MSKSTSPQHAPAALEHAAEALQEAAGRLLAQGVPLEDVTTLAEAVRAYVAQHAADRLTSSTIRTTTSPVYRGAATAVGTVRAAPLPLTPDSPQERPAAPHRTQGAPPPPQARHTPRSD